MGSRANFVLIDSDGVRLHYSRWAAGTIWSALVAGPEAATRFISALDRADGWLDDVWAEGGAAVDHTTRRLTWFGDHLTQIPAKRVFAALLERTWPGWQIRWAYDGPGDIAAAAGVDREEVRCPPSDEREPPTSVTDDPDLSHLISVATVGGLTMYPVFWTIHAAWQGPEILDRLPAGGVSQLELSGIPESGLHIDARTRTAGVWLTENASGLVPALTNLWPGWRIEFWEDRYEEQLARCGGAMRVPAPEGPVAVLDKLIGQLARRRGKGSGRESDSEWAAVLDAGNDLRIEFETNIQNGNLNRGAV